MKINYLNKNALVKNKVFLNLNKMRNDKRGSYDLLVFIVLGASLAIFFLVVMFILPQITQALRNSDLNNSQLSLNALNASDTITASFNYVYLVVFVGLIIGILISSAMIPVNKIFIPIYIILFIIEIVIGAIMNNLYEAFKADPNLAATAATFTFGNTVIENYIPIVIAVGILSFILIFGKTRTSGERL